MISALKEQVINLGKRIGIKEDSKEYPFFSETKPAISDGWYVFWDQQYVLVYEERGKEVERIESQDAKDILYRIFESITFRIASEYELDHRVENQDFRRILFDKQVELLSIIDASFAKKLEEEIKQILMIAPFLDEE